MIHNITDAHTAALLEDLWRCDSSGNVLPVADSYRRRAAQHSVADAWSTGSTFALMDALSATETAASKVSLVKSAPVTYCTDVLQSMWQRWIGRNNDLNMLRMALKG